MSLWVLGLAHVLPANTKVEILMTFVQPEGIKDVHFHYKVNIGISSPSCSLDIFCIRSIIMFT